MVVASLFGINVAAQDVIIFRNGDEVDAKIIELGVSEVKYKKWSNQDGPMGVAPKGGIFMIKYQNGEKEVFEAQASACNSQSLQR